jgi:hypothetical protein
VKQSLKKKKNGFWTIFGAAFCRSQLDQLFSHGSDVF